MPAFSPTLDTASWVLGALTGRGGRPQGSPGIDSAQLPYFTDPIAMMASGSVDAVVTTEPSYLHPGAGDRGDGAGPCTCSSEKPLGVYTKQVRRMLAVGAATPSVVLGAMFNQRVNPLFSRLKQILSSGEIGNVRRATWRSPSAAPWRGRWRRAPGGPAKSTYGSGCSEPQASVYAKVPFGFAHDIDGRRRDGDPQLRPQRNRGVHHRHARHDGVRSPRGPLRAGKISSTTACTPPSHDCANP